MTANPEHTAPATLKDPWCAYTVVTDKAPGGWMVAYVEANEPGYYSTTYTGDKAYCDSVADSINESKGLTRTQVLGIAHSSIAYPGAHYYDNPFEVGDWADHKSGDLDPREVAEVEGAHIRLRIGPETVTDLVPADAYDRIPKEEQT